MLKMQALVLVLLCAVAQGRVFERCEWARFLKSRGMDGYKGVSLANWVCLTQWESSFDTSRINHNRDKSTDYGIFQINSKYWCKDGGVSKANECGIYCTALLTDDPTTSINCAKKVVQQQGISAWVAWNVHCKGQDVRKYIAGCGVELTEHHPQLL